MKNLVLHLNTVDIKKRLNSIKLAYYWNRWHLRYIYIHLYTVSHLRALVGFKDLNNPSCKLWELDHDTSHWKWITK